MFKKKINKNKKTKISHKLIWYGVGLAITIALSIYISIQYFHIADIADRINITIAITTFWSAIFVAYALMTSIQYNEYNIEQQNKIALQEIRWNLLEDLRKYFYYHQAFTFDNFYELMDKDENIKEKITLAFSDNIIKDIEVSLKEIDEARKEISAKIKRNEEISTDEQKALLNKIIQMRKIIVKESRLVE